MHMRFNGPVSQVAGRDIVNYASAGGGGGTEALIDRRLALLRRYRHLEIALHAWRPFVFAYFPLGLLVLAVALKISLPASAYWVGFIVFIVLHLHYQASNRSIERDQAEIARQIKLLDDKLLVTT